MTTSTSSTVANPSSENSSSHSSHRKEKFLDQYLSSIETFPTFLQQKLAKIRQFDEQCVEKVRVLDKLSKQHIENIKNKWANNTNQNQNNAVNEIESLSSSSIIPSLSSLYGAGSHYEIDSAEIYLRSLQDEISKLSKSKTSLTIDLYESLDSHVRRLDSSLKKFETKLRKGGFEISSAPLDRRRNIKRILDNDAKDIAMNLLNEMREDIDKNESNNNYNNNNNNTNQSNNNNSNNNNNQNYNNIDNNINNNSSSSIHSNEPVYCNCRKISYGNMVACDNDDCEIEWFHFACVGLEVKPRGKWFCADCRKKMKKKLKT